jgi:hypothetical protein
MMPPPNTITSPAPFAAHDRQAHPIDVLLDGGIRDHLGRLMEPRVDHLEPGVPQGSRDDLGPPVVPVETGLGHENADFAGVFRWLRHRSDFLV